MSFFTPLHAETIGTLIDAKNITDIGKSHSGVFDGAYCGVGYRGKNKIVFIIHDYSHKGGSFGPIQNAQVTESIETAIREKCPLLIFLHTGGVRLEEGADNIYLSGYTFNVLCRASGYIPIISVISGPSAGIGAYIASVCDCTIFIQGKGQVFMTGPKVIEAAIGRKVSKEELGGTYIHSHLTGLAAQVAHSAEDARQTVQKLLELFPSSAVSVKKKLSKGPVVKKIKPILPANQRGTYDMHLLVEQIVEKSTYVELFPYFARNLITGLGHFENITIGIIANQPRFLSGALDVKSANKLTRFVQICDAYDIPMIFLVDCPGFLPGDQQEHSGAVSAGGKAAHMLLSCTAPKITIVVRRMMGGSYPVMNGRGFGGDCMLVWENSEVAIMDKNAAGRVSTRKAETIATLPELLDKKVIDKIIEPEDTAIELHKALSAVISKKKEHFPPKRRIILPM